MEPFARERARNVSLALALSAGLHLIAMLTLDLSPGSWRHGFAPALRVVLKQVPGAAPAGEVALELPLSVPEIGSPARRQPEPRDPGLEARAPQAGASLPVPEHYFKGAEVDVPAVPVSRGPLIFPEHAYVSRLAGTVRARVFISAEGGVDAVEIVEVRPLRGIFEEAALEALRQVRYRPAEIRGQPVKSQKLIEVTFNPYDDPVAR